MERDRIPERPRARALAPTRKTAWPEGATAGLMLVAAMCLALSLAIYQVAGPRDVFAEEMANAP